ncbi:hypothetical protein [Chelativorans sp. Marseille-P2723]|uniref:hypothetical protein n=1 Tax=Chelativorans sp. Marseille-P2723 TaxID=2709133 RepID=UPI00156F44A1|nr:hypothetical protein [Chelativorans sp. Marseille-P2723]
MPVRKSGIRELGLLMSRAMVAVAFMTAPLAMIDVVQASDENIIEGSYKAASGAGFVLMVSLQRAR